MMKTITQIISVLKELIPLLQKQLRLKKNEEMVRRICKEEGLTSQETNRICKVIHCESGFDEKAIWVNIDGSKDLGLIQANTNWYIQKMGLLTYDEAINNPEKCVRIMIRRYKEGFLKDWACYKTQRWQDFSGTI